MIETLSEPQLREIRIYFSDEKWRQVKSIYEVMINQRQSGILNGTPDCKEIRYAMSDLFEVQIQ